MCGLSFVIVWICSLFFKIKTTARNLLVCILSFPNTGALPLIFVGALEEAFMTEAKATGNTTISKDTFDKAVGFIMLNACIQTLLRWSLGYDLMRKPAELKLRDQQQDMEVQKKEGQSEFMIRLKEIINPTLVSSIIAIVIASIPVAKGLFYVKGGEAPLYNTVFNTIKMIGANGKSIMTIQLGCNLAMIMDEKAADEEEQLTTTDYVLNVVLKNLLYPFIALIVVMPLLWAGFMYDPMQSFIAMLQIASPSAITMTVMTNIHKFLEKETAKCFIYQYLVSIVTLTLSSA
eukprot:CAMPEP_0168330554 /NCGR_PEP_ID=MMETSP0213-20121227/7807_1 /TAXON_ID=151035 /ORGANISM="Euplotes harpa, Strain FSP1.4" /LENGTH=289 /DNA_ID=CAMNT_0008334161 /DNA_START=245 /DNA_END=1111 /DNA_ORIENTATION=+